VADCPSSQHRDRQFGNHLHVQTDAIPLLDAQRLEHVGELANVGVQLLVCHHPLFGRFVAFPNQGRLIAACLQVPIERVDADVRLAPKEPLNADVALEGVFANFVPFLVPDKPLGNLCPKPFRILDGPIIHLLVGFE